MTPPLLLALLGLLYILVFGGLMFLRQEGISARFAIEASVIVIIVAGVAQATGFAMNPALFLILLHVITMRARLLVDLGNALAWRKEWVAAARAYAVAARLWPDDASRLIVRMNQGVLALQRGQLDDAIAGLRQVLAEAASGYLGAKHESACHYNLAVAYQKKGLDAQATLEFNAVLDTWPASEYARYASIALERRRKAGAGDSAASQP